MKLTTQRACITGLGFVSSIGNNAVTVQNSLQAMATGIRPHRFLGEDDRSYVKVAGVVDGFDFSSDSWAGWTYPAEYKISKDLRRSLPPHGFYAYSAIEQALSAAKLTKQNFSSPRIGLFCASAGSPLLMRKYLNQMHDSKGRRGAPLGIVSAISGSLNFILAAHYEIQGASSGFVSACSSSSHAIGYAIDEIRLGRQDAIMIVGAEDFTAESMLPFAAMNALSKGTDASASKPWDVNRDGFVGTGGACALLIESESFAKHRGAQPLSFINGWGQGSDGFDMTTSHPDGAGLIRAIDMAMADAQVAKESIDYINAHATSTPIGDLSEANALKAAFLSEGLNPIISSTKGITGHSLSMSGAMEAAFCTLFLKDQFYSGNANLKQLDPACEGLNLPTKSSTASLKRVMSNSSGFGGSNVSLILSAS